MGEAPRSREASGTHRRRHEPEEAPVEGRGALSGPAATAFLKRAGELIHASIDYETTLTTLARLAVPEISDWCTVDVVDPSGALKRVAMAHVDPDKEELGWVIARHAPISAEDREGAGKAIRESRSLLIPEIPDEILRSAARDAEHLRMLRSIGFHSAMVVPLIARGTTLGALTFATTAVGRRFGPEDLEFAEELARRCALAVDNARLYRDARAAERQKDESLALLDLLLSEAPAGFALWDSDLRFMRVNDAFARMTGLPLGDHLGRRIDEVVPGMGSAVAEHLKWVLENDQPRSDLELTATVPGVADSCRHWLASCYPVRAPDGSPLGLGAVVSDTTDRRRAEEELRESEERFRLMVEGVKDYALLTLDVEGRVVSWNAGAQKIKGYTAEEILGEHASRFYPPEDVAVGRPERNLRTALTAGRCEDEGWRVRRDGSRFFAHVVISALKDDAGNPYGFAKVTRDITERRQFEEQLAHQALHDHLTDLPNRSLFLDRVALALARSNRSESSVALLFLDLDRFKVINDSLGHAAGDELLRGVAGRLSHAMRACDTVARFGGDEFAVLCEDLHDQDESIAVAERIEKMFEAPFELAGVEVFAQASIGIVRADGELDTAEDLLRDADAAMYEAKAGGPGRHRLFNEEMRLRASRDLSVESGLRRAIEADGFGVVYQRLVELGTGRVVGAEALVRWNHPTRGVLEPAEFISVAEETGLIHRIGAFVIDEACGQIGRWAELHPDIPSPAISVNLSALQFEEPELVKIVEGALSSTQIDPSLLCLEMTESVLMSDARSTITTLMALKGLGVRLAIDDFGTGYSSLGYLNRFPVNLLKIDGSFVRGLGRRSDDTALVAAIVRMAQALGLRVVAEGIETAEQLAELRSLGCDLGQGYLLGRPEAPEDFFEAMRASSAGSLRRDRSLNPLSG